MTTYRMAFRFGIGGYDVWDRCRELAVAAIGYGPQLAYEDLSKRPPGEPEAMWNELSPGQKGSLKKVVYDMRPGDVIYVKQAKRLVGRGVVAGPYFFDTELRITNPTVSDDWPLAHQVLVKWDTDFTPIELSLGSEQTTVLRLDGERLQRLEKAIAAVRAAAGRVHRPSTLLPEQVDPGTAYPEGAARSIRVNAYERSARAREACIAYYGAHCSVCGISLAERYGPEFDDVVVVHHLVPVAQIGKTYKVNPIQDLRPVCPNCHAVIHSHKPPFSIDEVREMLKRTDSATAEKPTRAGAHKKARGVLQGVPDEPSEALVRRVRDAG